MERSLRTSPHLPDFVQETVINGRTGYFPWVRTGLYPSTVNTWIMKKETSLTPFRSALKIFIFEFNDSAEALVSLLMK